MQQHKNNVWTKEELEELVIDWPLLTVAELKAKYRRTYSNIAYQYSLRDKIKTSKRRYQTYVVTLFHIDGTVMERQTLRPLQISRQQSIDIISNWGKVYRQELKEGLYFISVLHGLEHII